MTTSFRRLAAFLALVLLALLLVWAIATDDPSGGAQPGAGEGQAADEDARPNPALEGAADIGAADIGAADSGAADSGTNAPGGAPGAVGAEQSPLTGTVDAVRGREEPVPVKTGTLELELTNDDVTTRREVRVRGGTFVVPVPHGSRVRFRRLRVKGSWRRFMGRPAPVTAPHGAPVALRVRIPLPTVLRVIDAETRALLGGVRVVSQLPGQGDALAHPGPYHEVQLVVSGAASPVPLARHKAAADTFWVGAPGYAWRRIRVSWSWGGERLVALRRAGGIRVRLERDPPTRFMDVRIYPADSLGGMPTAQFRISGEAPIPIEGLAAGAYVAVVEQGAWTGTPTRVASAPVHVETGSTAEVTLEVERPAEAKPAPIAGELVLPSAWKLTGFSLVLTRVDQVGGGLLLEAGRELKRVAGREGVWRFADEDVDPGPIEFFVEETGYRVVLDIPPEGNEGIRVAVPEPARVSLGFTDTTTGENAAFNYIQWQCMASIERTAYSVEDAQRNAGSGRYEFRAPLGPIRVWPGGARYGGWERTIEILPGLNRHDVELAPVGTIVVVVEEGETLWPWPHELGIQVHPVEGPVEGRVEGRVEGPGRARVGPRGATAVGLLVDRPGRYRVVLPQVPGFATPEPQEVEVASGATKHVVFRLESR